MSGSLGRPNLREKAATTADNLKCIGRWRSARNRTSRPLRGLAPIDVQTAMPRSRRHSSRNICRATSWNIIGDVRGVMSPGRAVSIPCWRRGAGRGPMSGSQRRCPTYSISVTFSIGDFFAEHRRGRSSLPRRPLLTALPRRAVYGGADRAGLIFFSFFFLGLLLLHSLIGLLPHFFEVIGFRLTRFPR